MIIAVLCQYFHWSYRCPCVLSEKYTAVNLRTYNLYQNDEPFRRAQKRRIHLFRFHQTNQRLFGALSTPLLHAQLILAVCTLSQLQCPLGRPSEEGATRLRHSSECLQDALERDRKEDMVWISSISLLLSNAIRCWLRYAIVPCCGGDIHYQTARGSYSQCNRALSHCTSDFLLC